MQNRLRHHFFRKWLTYLTLAIGLSACGKGSNQAPPGPTVEIGHPTQKTITEWDDFSGRFQAAEQVDIRARVSGYLDKVQFTDGQIVKKDDVLFQIDQRPLKNALVRAQAGVVLAQKVYKRSTLLRDKKFIADETVDQNQQAAIQAETAQTDAMLNLEYSEVRSPIAGRVGRHLVDAGNLVVSGDTGGTLLTTVVSLDPIDFYFIVSEQDLLKFNKSSDNNLKQSAIIGHPVEVRLGANDPKRYQGVIDFVDNAIDKNTGTIELRATLPNSSGTLVPGLFGRIRVASTAPYSAILVPENIIGTNQTQKFVYVLGKNNTAEVRPVVLGPTYENGLRIIRSGLTPTDTIIINGIARIRPGILVSVKK